jgi:hypothetical protein
MKYLLLIYIIACSLGYTSRQMSNSCMHCRRISSWDSTKNWRIYNLENLKRVVQVTADSLKLINNTPLNNDSMHSFLSSCRKLAVESPVWMGCYLVSYEDPNGQVRKVIVSHYAGFFYSEAQDSYFEIDSSMQQDWLNFLSNNYIKLQ